MELPVIIIPISANLYQWFSWPWPQIFYYLADLVISLSNLAQLTPSKKVLCSSGSNSQHGQWQGEDRNTGQVKVLSYFVVSFSLFHLNSANLYFITFTNICTKQWLCSLIRLMIGNMFAFECVLVSSSSMGWPIYFKFILLLPSLFKSTDRTFVIL